MTSILWYSNETPDVHGQGGQRRQYFQIRSLVDAGHDVTVVSLAGDQADDSIRQVAEVGRVVARARRGVAVGADTQLISSLPDMDVDRVVVAHLESWAELRRSRIRFPQPVLVDLHNVLSRWRGPGATWSVRRRWARLERGLTEHVDAVTVCSLREQAALRAGAGVDSMVVPHGIEPAEWPYPPQPGADPVIKLFGNWTWPPNGNGLHWFLSQVWPRVRGHHGLRCQVAGGGTDRWRSSAPDVDWVGRVPDVAAFLADAWAVCVPVINGVGAPVKLGESLVAGAPLLLTPEASDSAEVDGALVAAAAGAWVSWLRRLLEDPEPVRLLAATRRAETLSTRTWVQVSRPLVDWASS